MTICLHGDIQHLLPIKKAKAGDLGTLSAAFPIQIQPKIRTLSILTGKKPIGKCFELLSERFQKLIF